VAIKSPIKKIVWGIDMKIYLVRHGETIWNKEKKMAYNKDLVLTDLGIEQAKELALEVNKIDYDFIMTSPFIRTLQTTEIINTKNKKVIIEERLAERNVGILDGKDLIKEIDFYEVGNYYKNLSYEGAEDMQTFCKRIWSFLDEIKTKYQDKKIIFVTHGYVCIAIKAYLYGIPSDGNLKKYGTKNCFIEELDL
jgi:probable phosphoglycerate mutase